MLRFLSKGASSGARRTVLRACGVSAAPPGHFSQLFARTSADVLQCFSTAADDDNLPFMRNIGISAHIDSGKTTLTERILFYTGRINAIHDVRGKDGVGAKMDSMDLEREKGITIQSAATFCQWVKDDQEYHYNIIDTPGHVDFTVEVERALRVLDGAILVLCGVSGVQSQSITVDRQMKRYSVPRLAFINKLDREGADPDRVISDLCSKLELNACGMQLPIGLSREHEGCVDLLTMKAIYSRGDNGEKLEVTDIPEDMVALAEERRAELVERIAEVDDEIAEIFLMDEEPTVEELKAAIRRATIANTFVPVYMGSAFKNKGVQNVLDAVTEFLPCPTDVENYALRVEKNAEGEAESGDKEERVLMKSDSSEPLVALAFKLEESRFGQLTYMRVYQGAVNRGDWIYNSASKQKLKVPRIVRMHSNEMEDIDSAGAGEIFAIFGVECASGDTFTHEESRGLSMESMFVPQPVMSLAVEPKKTKDAAKFGKALKRFTREDPTFRRYMDEKTGETIISGMGELHLQIYIERMLREYDLELNTGAPRVSYTEQITQRSPFSYTHKKQTGGQGMYAKVEGFIEPLEEDSEENFVFENRIVGTAIPNEYFSAIEAGFRDAVAKGPQVGGEVQKVRVAIEDGASHQVDSSELAFRIAAALGFKQAFEEAGPQVLEPVMAVEVHVPSEFTSNVLSQLNQKKGMINDTAVIGQYTIVKGSVPLSSMFGYSSDLRSATQGKGEFTMEYQEHQPVTRDIQAKLMADFQAQLQAEREGN